ncbi:MAG: NCS2 family permease [Lachnospiraceae bacterium]|nr:NCS2 family permease [Lachnospiraceae bacterium]
MKHAIDFFSPKHVKVETTFRTEVLAGVTSFFASIFTILAVPNMIGIGGPDGYANIRNAVFVAAVISAVIGCLFMAFIAKMPLVVYPAMGTTSYFAFSALPMIVVLSGDENLARLTQYQIGMFLILITGVLFSILAVTGLTDKILNGIPKNIKIATVPAIGLFITLLGLRLSGLVVGTPSTFVAFANLRNLRNWATLEPSERSALLGAIVAFIGLLFLGFLHYKKVKASFVIAIVVTAILAYVTGAYSIDNFTFSLGQQFRDWANYGLFRFDAVSIWSFSSIGPVIGVVLSIILALLLTNALDAIATTFGIAKGAGLVKDDNDMEGRKYVNKGVVADALSSVVGACLGGAPNTTVVSGSAGVNAGGRTGLTSLVVAILTALLLIAGPFVGLIPNVAIAPALIFVGCLMLSGLKDLDFSDMTDYLPAFVALIMVVFTFNIGTGICLALLTHILLKLVTGRVKEISLVSVIVTILFLLQFIL